MLERLKRFDGTAFLSTVADCLHPPGQNYQNKKLIYFKQ